MNDNCSEIEQASSKTYSYSSCSYSAIVHKKMSHSSYDSHVQEEEHSTKKIPQLDGCVSLSSLSDSSVFDLTLSSSFCSSDDSSGNLTSLDNCILTPSTHPNLNPDKRKSENKHSSNIHINSSYENIPQLDGNVSNDTLDSSSLGTSIETLSITDEHCSDHLNTLPRIYSANGRSIFPKFADLIEKINNHRLDIIQISETWQDVNKDDHKHKIDILENHYGFKWYSFARSKYRDDGSATGGGGTAVLVNQRNFSSSIIQDITIPKNIEVVWVKVIPKQKSQFKSFIICGIYSKPNSKTKTILNDHIATNFHLQKMKNEGVKFFFLGDFNDHKPHVILQLSPQLRQVVHHQTYRLTTLDLIITDAHALYHPPIQEPPLLPDDPASAAPSDHHGNLLVPRSDQSTTTTRPYKLVTVRPITQSQMNALGKWIVKEQWEDVLNENNTDTALDIFTSTVFTMLDAVAPTKNVKIACQDPAWMNSRIKSMIRRRNREFDRHGKTQKWKSLKLKCHKLCKRAKNGFITSFISNIKDKDPRTWMVSMKKLGQANHENENVAWSFTNEQKTDQELTDEISNYFAEISGNFTPIDRSLIPSIPQTNSPFVSEVPCFPQEHEVYTLLKKSKKTSSVPNDLPIQFLKEFLPELTKPVFNIYCKSIASGIFPTRWKNEYVSPHPKVLPPTSYKDLRNLSLTEFLAKSFERFLLYGTSSVNGLLFYIKKYIDPNQFAVSGSSCNHALLKMIDFILSATDDPNKPTAVANLLADWSKAFNKCNHNIIMRILTYLKVPMWLLRLVMSYLEHRKMILRFRGCSSSPKDMPGGMPQGTLLGVILYILYINPVGFPAEATIKISNDLHNYWNILDRIPDIPKNDETLPPSLQAVKFMDDATIQERINLITHLASSIDRSGPLPFWELGDQQANPKVLPGANSLLQNQIVSIKNLSDQREMSLNPDKTCLFIVNFSRQHQFRPLLEIPGRNLPIERVLQTKLLGYWFSHDMKTNRHVEHLLAICYKRIWAIRKLKKSGISEKDILHFYNFKIRSVLEANCIIYHSMLTQEETNDIERIQKIVLKIILANKYEDYNQACLLMNIDTLETRRINLSLNFGLKCISSEQHSHFFQLNKQTSIRNPEKFHVPFARTSRYFNSPKLYITRLLNEHFAQS